MQNEKENLLKALRENLLLRNYSSQTIKSYIIHISKYLEFLEKNKQNQQPTFENAKEYILLKLKKNNPSLA